MTNYVYGSGTDAYGNPNPTFANGLVVQSGDSVEIHGGGSAFNLLVEDGGFVTVKDGGIVSFTTVQANGELDVIDNGTASNTTLSGDEAYEYVRSGTIVQETVLSGAEIFLGDGGHAFNTSVGSQGGVFVAPGGIMEITSIAGGGMVFMDGTGSGTTVSANGQLFDEGVEIGATVLAGGTQIAAPASLVSGSTINSGGLLVTLAYTGVLNDVLPDGETARYVRRGDTIDYFVNGSLAIEYNSGPGGLTATGFDDDGDASVGSGPNVYNAFRPGRVDGITVQNGGQILLAGGDYSNITQLGSSALRIGGAGFPLYFTSGGLPGTATTTGTAVSGLVVSTGQYVVVSSGGDVVGADVAAGATLALDDTGIANTTVVEANGLLLVSSGATTSGDVLYGSETVLAGGREQGAQVQSGGVLQILLNGSGSGATLLASGKEVVAGSASATYITSGAVVSVLSGGVTDGDGVLGTEVVAAGGSAGPLAVGSGGLLLVSGGTASGTHVQLGGRAGVLANGELLGLSIDSGGLGIVSSGGIAPSAAVAGGGELAVFAGGGVDGVQLATSAKLTVSGGIAYNTVVLSGAVVSVFQNGQTNGDVVLGFEVVGTGGSAGTVAVGSGGTLRLSGGTASNVNIQTGAKAGVYDGGLLVDATVQSGGLAVISSGGSGQLNVVGSGGELAVFAGGAELGTNLLTGAKENVFGGTTTATQIASGALQNVSGGVASGSYVAGFQSVLSGGTTVSSYVSSGGVLRASGGIASGALVQAGGAAGAFVGGVLAGMEVQSAGLAVVSSGGSSLLGTVDTGGELAVFDGGTVAALTLQSLAKLTVSGGSVSNTSVGSGAVVSVYSGVTQGDVVEGFEVVGGGSANSLAVLDGGTLRISGGTASNAFIESGGKAGVYGGTLLSSTVDSGGLLVISAGGTASGISVAAGAQEAVFTGATDVGTTVASAGLQNVFGGTVSGTQVQAGATQQVSGGVVSAATVLGVQLVSSGGQSVATVIASGGSARFEAGSTASALVVSSGGTALLSAGGTYAGITLAGGTVELQSLSDVVSGSLQFADVGGILQVDMGLQGTTTISGFAVGDALDDLALAYDPAGTVTAHGDIVTVSAGGTTFDLNLVGTAGAGFALSPVAGNGAVYTRISETTAPCFLRGTLLETPEGEVAVEALREGDLVLTAAAGPRPVRWIGTRAYDSRFVRNDPAILPIRLEAGSLGAGLPRRPLWVSPEHAMFLDNALVPAKLLVNGTTITQDAGLPVIEYFHVELDSHDVLLAEGAPTESFVDCDSRAMFQNAHEFTGQAPRWTFCAPRVEDGERLARILAQLNAPALPPGAAVHGHLDTASHEECTGWAWCPADPAAAMTVEILVDGGVVARTVANLHRPDVAAHGFGHGRYGFAHVFAPPLTRSAGHVVEARVVGGARLTGSVALEPIAAIDLPGLGAVLQARAATEGGAGEVAAFLRKELVRLSGPVRRSRSRLPLALVLDELAPVQGRDAGSAAIISHMRSLRRLGFRVVFVPLDREAAPVPGFNSPPAHQSLEDVLRQHTDAALVYVHRVGAMSLYGPLVRRHIPGARLVFAVADLHFLRVGRQAVIEGDPALLAQSRHLLAAELAAAKLADAVVTHSAAEAAVLRRQVPDLVVHVVPWSVPARPSAVPWSARHGLLFVGAAVHAPNADAVRWLRETILPLLRVADPAIRCTLVGHGLDARNDGTVAPGHVPDIAAAYAACRVAVAPLRFGAGVKGKVVEAFAHGVPCVMTPVAAEGLALPAGLQAGIAADPTGFVAAVLRLYHDEAAWAASAQAGLAMAASAFSEPAVDEALGRAVASHRATLVRTGGNTAPLASAPGLPSAETAGTERLKTRRRR